VLAVLLLLLLGVAVGRARLLPEGSAAVLDATVIRLALPALVLAEVTAAELGLDAIVPVAVAWTGLAVLAGTIWLGGRLLGADRVTVGTLLVVVPLGNTSFLGFPAITALLGQDRLALAVVYDQLGSFLALVTHTTIVRPLPAVRPRTSRRQVRARQVPCDD
jgi:malate permease and related proteins